MAMELSQGRRVTEVAQEPRKMGAGREKRPTEARARATPLHHDFQKTLPGAVPQEFPQLQVDRFSAAGPSMGACDTRLRCPWATASERCDFHKFPEMECRIC